MEYRKLIKFGGSSYIITMPNSWLKKNKLNKGDTLFLEENGNNELIISTAVKSTEDGEKQIVIDATNKQIDLLAREITFAYINNYKIIKIIGKGVNERAREIREILNIYVGIEIDEQTDNCIISRDFTNIREISVNNILRRMDFLIRTMIADSKLTGKESLYISIYQRDIDINKLFYLAQKRIKYGIESHESSHSVEFLELWELVRLLEQIADETKRISRWLKDITLRKEEEKDLLAVYSEIEKFYLDVMTCYFKKDKKQSFLLLPKKITLINKTMEFLEKHYKKIGLANLVEKFNSIIVNAHNINKLNQIS